jgi:hypothetical protein
VQENGQESGKGRDLVSGGRAPSTSSRVGLAILSTVAAFRGFAHPSCLRSFSLSVHIRRDDVYSTSTTANPPSPASPSSATASNRSQLLQPLPPSRTGKIPVDSRIDRLPQVSKRVCSKNDASMERDHRGGTRGKTDGWIAMDVIVWKRSASWPVLTLTATGTRRESFRQ